MEAKYVTIDGIPVEFTDERNLLEVIRKAGIDMPTFCYHPELSIYGACRMCMFEDERGNLDAACSARPRNGMKIKTNTARLRKYRKNILELLLANHCRDCTTCRFSTDCKLQDFARRFKITDVRFPNTAKSNEGEDESSPCIVRDNGKCILCGECVRVCNEIQNVGAIDFAHRGSNLIVSTAFNKPINESTCVGCGQCAAVCPTGAIVVRSDLERVWDAISDPTINVSVQIAPAVRVGIGKQLGMKDGQNTMGKIVAALHRIGFNEVYDTSLGADLTVLEESEEFLEHVENNDLPLFTSCCPAWIQYCEKKHPELLPHVSTSRSPMQMFASIIKEQSRKNSMKSFHVAIMPCTAKKFEAKRSEFNGPDGTPNVDAVLTTQGLIRMIKEAGIVFDKLEAEPVDMPFGTVSGAGVIFGVTGGVTEAVLRRVVSNKSRSSFFTVANAGQRGTEGIKEFDIIYGDKSLHIAVVSGLGNAEKIIKRMENGDHFDFVEVMACPGGCVCGAGQPTVMFEEKAKRGPGLYEADRQYSIRRSEENPVMNELYSGILKGKVHEMLHVHYVK